MVRHSGLPEVTTLEVRKGEDSRWEGMERGESPMKENLSSVDRVLFRAGEA
jgi:hypothetical protein